MSSSEESSSSSEESSSSSEAKIYCVVTFDLGYGDLSFTQQVEKYDKAVKPNDPVRDGYSFLGWKDENGDTWVFNGYSITKDMTLYAQWSDPIDYSVRFVNDDETLLYATTAHYGDVVTYDGAAPESAYKTLHYDYDFIGWDKPLTITGDVILTAQYEVSYIETTVYYLDDDDTELAHYELDEGAEPVYPGETPTKADDEVNHIQYEFSRWEKIEETDSSIVYKARYYSCTQGLVIEGDTVTSYQGSAKTVLIPDAWCEVPITKIADRAFRGKTAITSIVMPDSLIRIGENAFSGCTGLTQIDIPKSVTEMGLDPFLGCTGLKNIYVDEDSESYTSIDGILYDKAVETLVRCPLARAGKVTVPSTVKTIGDYGFSACSSLASLALPEGLLTLRSYALSQCSALKSIQLPSTLVELGSYALFYCSGISGIALPSGLTSIGDHAFYGCTELYTIVLPAKVSSIGNRAFSNCGSLHSFTVDSSNQWFTATYDGCLYSKDYSVLYRCPPSKSGSLTIDAKTKTIEPYALDSCSSLTSISLPAGLTTIGASAFHSCTAVKTLVLPSTVASIGYGAFDYCSKLESINIPDGITVIESTAFAGCKALTSIVLPEGITSIGGLAFGSCDALASVSFPSTLLSIGERAFESDDALDNVVLPDSLQSIGSEAFAYCASIKELIVPANVSYIGREFVAGCKAMTSLTVSEDNVYYCAIDGTIYDKAVETAIASMSRRWGSITLPSSLKTIGEAAFRETSIYRAILPEGLVTIEEMAFHACTSLQSVVIPSTVTSIGTLAFRNCSYLYYVFYGGTPSSWDEIDIQGDNAVLLSKNRYYYSEQEPTEAGSYWHYVDGVPTVW